MNNNIRENSFNEKLVKMRNKFDCVKELKGDVSVLFSNLEGRISKLKEIYNEFIISAKTIKTPNNKVYIISLDSFYFQTSLLQKEYEYLKNYYITILNRMYGEYYKLFNLVSEYIEHNSIDIKMDSKNKRYPRYDDLDEEKEYDFHLIIEMNEDINNILNYLINILRDKENSLKQYTTNQDYGLNVNNFVSTFNYDVVVLQQNIELYIKHIEFFYSVHERLLKRLITKTNVLDAQLNTDVKFEDGLTSKKTDKKALFADMNFGALDKKTRRELRSSIRETAKSPSLSGTETETDDFIAIDKIHQDQFLDNDSSDLLHQSISTENVATKIFPMIGNNNESNMDLHYSSNDEEESQLIVDNIPIGNVSNEKEEEKEDVYKIEGEIAGEIAGEHIDENIDEIAGEHIDENIDEIVGEHIDENIDEIVGEHIDENIDEKINISLEINDMSSNEIETVFNDMMNRIEESDEAVIG